MQDCQKPGASDVPLTAGLAGDLGLFADTIWSAGTALSETARRHFARTEPEVSVAVGDDAVALAAPAWRSLEQAGGAATPFQTLAMAEHAAQVHLQRAETPRIVVVHNNGAPAVIVPTVLGRTNGIPTLRFLGDPLIQYGDAIAAPDTAPGLIDTAYRMASASSGAWLVHLRKVRDDARIAGTLQRNARLLGEQEAPFVDMTKPPAESARNVRELRRLRRRLSELGDIRFEILQGAPARSAAERALDFKRDWLAARGLPSSVIGNEHWEHAVLSMAAAADGPMRAAHLTVGGRTAAVELGFVHGSHWYAFLGATEPEFAKAGPGWVQMAETVAHCRDERFASYDLLAPSDAYKRVIAHGAVTVRDYAAAIGKGGRLGVLAAKLAPAMKGLLALMPPAVQRSLMSWQDGSPRRKL